MKNVIRATLIIWALASLGLGALAFAVVLGTGGRLSIATREAFETIPEAAMQIMGLDGSPLWLVITYWLVLIASFFLAFRRR